jgi:hypothetical protein
MIAAVAILLVPLGIFTALDRGWFDEAEAIGARDVAVELRNWEIDLSRTEITAGEVNFLVKHEDEGGHDSGDPGETHNLVVVRRDAGGAKFIADTRPLHPGEEELLVMELAPGDYDVFCSIVEEYDGEPVSHDREGMRTTFRVKSAPEAEGEARSNQ